MKKKYLILLFMVLFLLNTENNYSSDCTTCPSRASVVLAVTLHQIGQLPIYLYNFGYNVLHSVGDLFHSSYITNSSNNNSTNSVGGGSNGGTTLTNITTNWGVWATAERYSNGSNVGGEDYGTEDNYPDNESLEDDVDSSADAQYWRFYNLFPQIMSTYMTSQKNWYLDHDGDGYYSQIMVSVTCPGAGWADSLITPPLDCDDNDVTKTDNCSCPNNNVCPPNNYLVNCNCVPQAINSSGTNILDPNLNGISVLTGIIYDLGITTQSEIEDCLDVINNMPPPHWFKDVDGDGWESGNMFSDNSPGPEWKQGYSNGLDCDDTLPKGYLVQNACTKITWMLDADGDHWTAPNSQRQEYKNWPPEPGYIKQSDMVDDYYTDDCDDNDATISEDCPVRNWYLDNDHDGYDAGTQQADKSPGIGWVEEMSMGIDCDDNDEFINTCPPNPTNSYPTIITPANCRTTIGGVCGDESENVETRSAIINAQNIDHFNPQIKGVQNYIFDENGNFKGVDKNHKDDKILIKTANGYKTPSQLDVSFRSRKTMTRITATLARSLDGTGKGIVIRNKVDDVLSSVSPAATGSNSANIYLNINGGFSKALDNLNNFKSVIKHEIFHVVDNQNLNFVSTLSTHADVYIKAANDPTYKSTTLDFKIGNAGSFANYLLNMDKRADATFSRSVIMNKITEFNKNGYITIEYVEFYPQKGSLRLKVKYGSLATDESDELINTPINQ